MTLIKWDPFRDLMNLHQRPSTRITGTHNADATWVPPVDIFEKGDELVIRAELPGLEKSEIDISVEDNRLVIHGERVRESEFDETNAYRLERKFGSFVRSFMLSKTIDATRIAAGYLNGVLEIKLPKAEAAKPRKIEIAAA